MAAVRWIPTTLGVIALGLGLLAAGRALTATNVVPAGQAGDGTATVTGYTVSAIHSLLGREISVPTAGMLTVSFSLLAALAALLLLRPLLAARAADEPTRIRTRYAELLLNIQNGPNAAMPKGRVVEVESIEDVARVATQQGRMILHLHSDGVLPGA